MSDSSLVVYTHISPHHSGLRNHVLDTISIHCMAFDGTVEVCGHVFDVIPASSQYGIGSDGRMALYVNEKYRSWCTSSGANDNRAVTIEVANDGDASTGWHVSDAAMKSLILLCADICKRNGIKKLLWQADKSLIGHVDKQNMTVHRWFAAKACPGDYLYSKHSYIANEVNKLLNEEDEMVIDFKDLTDIQVDDLLTRISKKLSAMATSDYAVEASEKGIASGLFYDGDTDGLIDNPKAFTTREQLAVVLNRAGLFDLLAMGSSCQDGKCPL